MTPVSVQYCAGYLGLSVPQVYALIDSGKLAAKRTKVDGGVLVEVEREELERIKKGLVMK